MICFAEKDNKLYKYELTFDYKELKKVKRDIKNDYKKRTDIDIKYIQTDKNYQPYLFKILDDIENGYISGFSVDNAINELFNYQGISLVSHRQYMNQLMQEIPKLKLKDFDVYLQKIDELSILNEKEKAYIYGKKFKPYYDKAQVVFNIKYLDEIDINIVNMVSDFLYGDLLLVDRFHNNSNIKRKLTI